jgi:hypothetical protein
MNSKMRSLGLVAVLLSSAMSCFALAADAPPIGKYYELTIDGTTYKAAASKPFTMHIGGSTINLAIRDLPSEFYAGDAAFQYPSTFAYSHQADKQVDIWMVQGHPAQATLHRDLNIGFNATVFAATLRSNLGKSATAATPLEWKTAKANFKGLRQQGKDASGATIVQEIFDLGKNKVFWLQDHPNADGTASGEFIEMKRLLSDSFVLKGN